MVHRRLIRCRPTVAFGTPDPVPLPAGRAGKRRWPAIDGLGLFLVAPGADTVGSEERDPPSEVPGTPARGGRGAGRSRPSMTA